MDSSPGQALTTGPAMIGKGREHVNGVLLLICLQNKKKQIKSGTNINNDGGFFLLSPSQYLKAWIVYSRREAGGRVNSV